MLESLASRSTLAIFTGRSQLEAGITLERERCADRFHIVTSDDVSRQKPDPEGLLQIMALHPGKELLYIGDTVDDARSARAAGVNFIGIAEWRPGTTGVIAQQEGAIAVLKDINELEALLCAAHP